VTDIGFTDFEAKREDIWQQLSEGLITEERFAEMLREVSNQEQAYDMGRRLAQRRVFDTDPPPPPPNSPYREHYRRGVDDERQKLRARG
jgi:hypothetical protein